MPTTKQPSQDKIPSKLSAQQRAMEQARLGAAEAKKRMQPPEEENMLGKTGGRFHELPPRQSLEQSVQGSSKGKQRTQPDIKGQQPQKPLSQQPPKEQSIQGSSKGKQPTQPDIKGQQPNKASSQQPPTEQAVRGTAKGKQPMQLPAEQLVPGKSTGKKAQQLPLRQPMQVDPEATQSDPKQPVQANTKGKRPERPLTQQSEQDNSKDEQPPRKPVHGFPRVLIARIPVREHARMRAAEVLIIPNTAYRHPQTFLVKNIPEVDRYWGRVNDAATTAMRIVRLEREGRPTPHFLLVCRGELPKVGLPRNENIIFENLHVPVFGDAFLFKLADPEINENGYARYVHIEEFLGDWIFQAIRDAAWKVEYATAAQANPGFPDMKNYADTDTMAKDVKRMRTFVVAYRKAGNKVMPEMDMVQIVIEKMTKQIVDWRKAVFPTTGGNSESSDPSMGQDYVQNAVLLFDAIERDVDGVLSASMTLGSSKVETTDVFGKVDHPIQARKDAFWGFLRSIQAHNDALEGGCNELELAIAHDIAHDAYQAMKAQVSIHEIWGR